MSAPRCLTQIGRSIVAVPIVIMNAIICKQSLPRYSLRIQPLAVGIASVFKVMTGTEAVNEF